MELFVREAGDAGTAKKLLVLLHGRGSDENDLLPLTDFLDPDLRVLSVRAPYRFGPGYAWYTYSDAGRPRLPQLEDSVNALTELVDRQHRGLPTILFGFSQGGQMAQALATRRAGTVVRALVTLSAPPLFDWPSGEPLKGLPVFWGHGAADPVVTPERGEETLAGLSKLGAAVSAHRYPMGHAIVPQEMDDVSRFLKDVKGFFD